MPNRNTPSIGCVGLTVDINNCRVKFLHDKVLSECDNVRELIINEIESDLNAINLLTSADSRFTGRVIVTKDLPTIDPFLLPCGLQIEEEARIKTHGLDIIYIGGNYRTRFNHHMLTEERKLSIKHANWDPCKAIYDTNNFTIERLTGTVSSQDVSYLLEMFNLCFDSYLVPLNENLIQNAAKHAIFYVARDLSGQIIASAIGESLEVGPLTFLEISEEMAHPIKRIRGAATACAKQVIIDGKANLPGNVIPFWEARMLKNILGMSRAIGLTEFCGVLHQHCVISSREVSIEQTKFGSLAVFAEPV